MVMLGVSVAVGMPMPAGAGTERAAPAEAEAAGEPGRDRAEGADPRLVDPYAAMMTFLDAMNRYEAGEGDRQRAMDEALAAFDFGDLDDRAAQVELAVLLKQSLDRIGEVRRADFYAFFDRPDVDRFVYFPRLDGLYRNDDHIEVARRTDADSYTIALERTDGVGWRFSRDTLEELDALFASVEGLERKVGEGEGIVTPAMRLRMMVPVELRTQRLLGIAYFQWLGLLAIIFVGLVADLTVRGLLRLAWSRVDRRRGVDRDLELIKKAVRPFGLVAAAAVWWGSLNLLGLPPAALVVLQLAARVVMSLAAIFAAFRLVDLLGSWFEARAAQTESKVDDLLVPLVRKTVKTFVFAMGLIYIAESFDIEILPLLTGLGIGGLAFAFAAKDTIENFFGSVAVILDRPFEVGDWVEIDGVEGTVETLGLRSTRIRTFYNSQITVPNATLVRATVDNYGRRRYRRFKTMLNLPYGTHPEKVEAFCEGIREIIRDHPYTRNDYFHVWLNQFGAHSLDVLVYMFHECPDWGTELRERHRFMLDVVRLADRLGVAFAFPTQTIELKRLEDGEHEPMPTPSRSADSAAQEVGRRAARDVTGQAAWRSKTPEPVTFTGTASEVEGPLGDTAD